MVNFEITVPNSIKVLLERHYSTLESVLDDFFEQNIVNDSNYYRIDEDNLEIEFFSLDDEDNLIQFFIIDEYHKEAKTIIVNQH